MDVCEAMCLSYTLYQDLRKECNLAATNHPTTSITVAAAGRWLFHEPDVQESQRACMLRLIEPDKAVQVTSFYGFYCYRGKNTSLTQ